jgi:NADP-dependent 3-hydroxy acid dehydrogenase YdfG
MSNAQESAMQTDLNGKVVLITGASSGIGEASARLLAAHGAAVVLGARRTDRTEALAREIESSGGKALAVHLDVASLESTEQFVHAAKERFGRIDVLFNNAGVMPLGPLREREVSQWNKMIDVNIRGVLNGIAAALPLMEAQGEGHLINTASIAAHLVFPSCAVYSATKFAVWAISEGLRQESKTVRVSIISPGVTATELGHDIADPAARDFVKDLRQTALTSTAIARAVYYAISQPKEVDVNEIVIRPVGQTI